MSLGLLSPVIDSRRAGSAPTRMVLSWLIAGARDLVAEALASLNRRIRST
jgi:hypothetical protein